MSWRPASAGRGLALAEASTHADRLAQPFLPPVFPRVGIGVQKSIGSRAAVRAELTTIVVGSDDFISPILHPSVSVTIPLGRYRKAGR